MSTAECTDQQQRVSRLVAYACEHGEPDIFVGKRNWRRYALRTRFEVTPDLTLRSGLTAVLVHNVSGGGLGFWSKKQFSQGIPVLVREWTPDGDADWIPMHVVHCSLGIGGYLIGASFDHPLPTEKAITPGEARSTAANESCDVGPTRASASRRSLRAKCALASAAASALGVAVVTQMPSSSLSTSGLWLTWLPVVAIALAFTIGGLGTWLFVGEDTRFLHRLRAHIQSLATGAPGCSALRSPPSADLAEVHQAVLELESHRRRQQEAECAHRAKLEELNLVKSNILNMVSHDLRTPLTAILLYAEMLQEEIGALESTDQQRFLDIISGECKRLSNLVDDLLEAQRIETGRFHWRMGSVDLAKTIKACALVFDAMAQSKAIKLTVTCPESLPQVEADADKIAQLLSNLVSNAIKYTSSGGTVQISAEVDGKDIVMCVADNGPGISRDQWDQIFDRFARVSTSYIREISGVGLGLYIVRQIVDRHGGRVWVNSELGRGAKFYVALPMRTTTADKDEAGTVTSAQAKAVVCDADPDLASRIAQLLREQNLDVRVAHSGGRLLAHLDQAGVDFVITDLLLPDMSSADLLTALASAKQQSVTLIAHTYGIGGAELRRKGIDIALQRPATVDELKHAVQIAMRQDGAARTVLLVADPSRQHKEIGRLLSQHNYIPLIAETREHAARMVEDYPINLIVVSERALKADWSDLRELDCIPHNTARIVVTCPRIRRKQRQLAETFGVTVAPYQTGAAAELLAEIRELSLARELTQ